MALANPLLFDEQYYNFTVMESDKVAEIVGVVSMQQNSNPLWFDIIGKAPPRGAGGWGLLGYI